jgi:hypothetical protein
MPFASSASQSIAPYGLAGIIGSSTEWITNVGSVISVR